jgi:micrococcal nuclease
LTQDAVGKRLRQPVLVHTRGRDDYGRTLAHVRHRGDDVGAWLVRQGLAWSPTFHRRPGPYATLQDEARQAHRGLWATAGAIEPRQFRRRHGRCD